MNESSERKAVTSYMTELLLHEEIRSLEAELERIRGSMRYRVGGIILTELMPLGRHSFSAISKLVRLYMSRRRLWGSETPPGGSIRNDFCTIHSNVIVYGSKVSGNGEELDRSYATQDAHAIARHLDAATVAGTLIIRRTDPVILRRMDRLRIAGWKLVWWPENSASNDPAYMSYVRSHCDEIRES